MDIKTILVHVEPTAESDDRLAAAAALAKAWDATLIGVGGSQPLYADDPLVATFGGGMAVSTCAEEDTRNLRIAEERFRGAARKAGTPAIWRADSTYPEVALEAEAAGADLVVTTATLGPRISTARAAGVVMGAGVPVLVLPPGRSAVATGRILVAWKNTREGRRAVGDAIPLLKEAREVRVVSFAAPKEEEAPRRALLDIVGRLRRRGVEAKADVVHAADSAAGGAILDLLQRDPFDLLVAGAYSRSRAHEWLLGGVTQSLLESSPIPVFFSH